MAKATTTTQKTLKIEKNLVKTLVGPNGQKRVYVEACTARRRQLVANGFYEYHPTNRNFLLVEATEIVYR